MDQYSDQEIIQGIKEHNASVLEYFYQTYIPSVRHLVKKYGGQEEEANDIFQDGILALFNNVSSEDFEWRKEAKLGTYFLQICKFRWFDQLKSARRKHQVDLGDIDVPSNDASIIELFEQVNIQKKVHQLIANLGDRCQEILKLYYWEKKSLHDISVSLKMEPASVKNGKYRCIQQLKKSAINILP